MGGLGLAINMRDSYLHEDISELRRDSARVVNNSCSKRANTKYDSMSQRWYGTPIEARVRLDPFAQGLSGGLTPFFLSPLLIIYL